MSEFIFNTSDYKTFDDSNNVMIEMFDTTCSVCGLEQIDWVRKDAPRTIGNIAHDILDENTNVSDEFLDDALNEPINEWQKFDDLNADNGIPTFLCSTCFEQLKNNEIKISDGQILELVNDSEE
ncbi:hypothetical protein [Spiroplasma endosymbiont of Labia minor]|uniref:hypothetical protein n=1 Tax=Spiroplasma endosymbiont of Labia minor TaxID=3066305 RepID=UPI0030D1E05F